MLGLCMDFLSPSLSLSLTPSLPQRRVAPKDGGRQCGLIKGGDGGQTGGVKEVSRWEVGLLSSAESRNPCVLRAVAHFTCSLFSKLHNKPTHCASNCTWCASHWARRSRNKSMHFSHTCRGHARWCTIDDVPFSGRAVSTVFDNSCDRQQFLVISITSFEEYSGASLSKWEAQRKLENLSLCCELGCDFTWFSSQPSDLTTSRDYSGNFPVKSIIIRTQATVSLHTTCRLRSVSLRSPGVFLCCLRVCHQHMVCVFSLRAHRASSTTGPSHYSGSFTRHSRSP